VGDVLGGQPGRAGRGAETRLPLVRAADLLGLRRDRQSPGGRGDRRRWTRGRRGGRGRLPDRDRGGGARRGRPGLRSAGDRGRQHRPAGADAAGPPGGGGAAGAGDRPRLRPGRGDGLRSLRGRGDAARRLAGAGLASAIATALPWQPRRLPRRRPAAVVLMARRWQALAVLILCLSAITLDSTIVNVALPSIQQALHTTQGGEEWVVDAYALPSASLLLAAGLMGDRHGRRRVMAIGMAVFGAASVLASVSPTEGWLIGARGRGGG